MNSVLARRVQEFTELAGIRLPILLAPMAGACPPALSIAVANAGGMGACGALLMSPEAILSWCEEFRHGSSGAFQLNLWIPDPPPARNREREARHREFLTSWGPAVGHEAGDSVLPDFHAQCEAMLAARPRVISSIMGVYAPEFVAEMNTRGILWFATATTVEEARAAEAAGAHAIVAQGMEAGGHRGTFQVEQAESQLVGLVALVPQVADAVSIPVIATGGIADARGVAAALMLGASAVMIGTGFLRAHESSVQAVYAERLASTEAHHTVVTRAFTGRAGSLSRTARIHARDAGGRNESRRRGSHADMVRPGSKISPSAPGRRDCATSMGGCQTASRLKPSTPAPLSLTVRP